MTVEPLYNAPPLCLPFSYTLKEKVALLNTAPFSIPAYSVSVGATEPLSSSGANRRWRYFCYHATGGPAGCHGGEAQYTFFLTGTSEYLHHS